MIDKRAVAYYNLAKMPFGKDLPADQLFVSAAFKELRSRLDYMKSQRGLMLLTGSPGVGKTAALRSFTASLNSGSYLVLYTPLSTVTVTDFYRQLNFALGGLPRWRKNDVFASIQNQIRDLVSQQKKIPVIILDESHLLSTANLIELQIIANFQMDSLDPALFILAGQSHLREKLASPVFDSLQQRMHMKFHLPALSQDEVEPFILHHLKVAGCSASLFSPDAVDAIYQNTAGIHRKVSLLAHRTLTVGAIQKKETLTSEEVFLAFKEL
ncbi:AAA family ATPase [bacterium]|nr:AAA family ATPase [bacterium]MCI0613758.1 AAA family ATPase [bacterium]